MTFIRELSHLNGVDFASVDDVIHTSLCYLRPDVELIEQKLRFEMQRAGRAYV